MSEQRKLLTKKNSLVLYDKDRNEIVYHILGKAGRSKGACTIGYKAERDGVIVVLKEFYPEVYRDRITRDAEGYLHFSGEDIPEKLDRCVAEKEEKNSFELAYSGFCLSASCVEAYSRDEELTDYICADPSTRLGLLKDRYGNEIYYENAWHSPSVSLMDAAGDADFSHYNMLQALCASFRFLKRLHEHGEKGQQQELLVDLKPEDILIPEDNPYQRNLCFHRPQFYDFGSVRPVGAVVNKRELQVTPIYQDKANAYKEEKRGSITLRLLDENRMYSAVSRVVRDRKDENRESLNERLKNNPESVYEKLLGKVAQMKTNDHEPEGEKEEQLEQLLQDCRNVDEQNNEENKKKMERRFGPLHGALLAFSVIIFALLGVGLTMLCVRSGEVRTWIEENHISPWGIAVSLLLLIGILVVAKFMVFRVASRLARPTICGDFYRGVKDRYGHAVYGKDIDVFNLHYHKLMPLGKKIRFWLNGRRDSTFIDDSPNNHERQGLRHVLWVVFGLMLAIGFVLSIFLQSLPVFVVAGFISILFLMYADVWEPTLYFFRTCNDHPSRDHQKNRAMHYAEEYRNTAEDPAGPFNPEGEFYRKNFRDLFHIRQQLAERTGIRKKNLSYKERLKEYEAYRSRIAETREEETEEKTEDKRDGREIPADKESQVKTGESARVDLDLPPLHMWHIYKMAFDRLSNNKLFVNGSVFFLMLVMVFMDFMVYTGHLTRYFRLPEGACFWITILLSVGVSVFSILQLIRAKELEFLIAEVSYKSRFVKTEALNDFLVFDIAVGVVIPVDILRGINQAEGASYTQERKRIEDRIADCKEKAAQYDENSQGERLWRHKAEALEKQKQRLFEVKNLRMLHHEWIGNMERVATTIWLCFGMAFCVLVWQMQIWWMVFPLLAFFAGIHLLIQKFLLWEITVWWQLRGIDKYINGEGKKESRSN